MATDPPGDDHGSTAALLVALLKHGHRQITLLNGDLGPREFSPAITTAANGVGVADIAATDIAETAEKYGVTEFAVVRSLRKHGVIGSPLSGETMDSE